MQKISRRKMILSSAVVLASGSTLLNVAQGKEMNMKNMPGMKNILGDLKSKTQNQSYLPVITPNGKSLPWVMKNGIKEFRLIAEPVKREFAPGLLVNCWGYNGQTPGPTIEAVEGDRVRILVTNHLPEPTSVHWHGVLLPNGMDGLGGLTQKHIEPGETYAYEFTLRQYGTQMYHPHSDEMTQIGLGMVGFFIIHPKEIKVPKVDRDFAIFLNEWFVPPGAATPDPSVMNDFNLFTFNGRVFPGTDPLIVKTGQRVRIRFGNLSMDSHPIHIHGFRFKITGTDAGPIPESAQQPETTVNVQVGSTKDIEFIADAPGDWALHCHKTHHVMNQMGHNLPNLIGIKTEGMDEKINKQLPNYMTMGQTGMYGMGEMNMGAPKNSIPMIGGPGPFGYIDMGGMFTIVKVRDGITNYEDPGWYKHPKGTVAEIVNESSDIPSNQAPSNMKDMPGMKM